MEWETVEIQDVAVGIYDGPHATPKESEDGPIFLGIAELKPEGGIDLSNATHLSEEDFLAWTRRVTPRANDIVFSYEATLHRYAIIPDDLRCCLGRRLALIRVDDAKADYRFIYYSLLSPAWRSQVEARTIAGATVERIPLIDFPSFKLRLPPLPLQHRIAEVLWRYDALIENYRRQISILEASAQTLYREWFVHERQSSFDAGESADQIVRLSELVDTQYGYTESSIDDAYFPKYLRVMDINKSSYITWESVPNCKIESPELEKYRLNKFDILIARMADPGKVAINEQNVNAVFASYLIRLSIKNARCTPYWLFYTLSSDFYQGKLVGMDSSSTRGSINAPNILSLEVRLPPSEAKMIEFEKRVETTRAKLNNLLNQIATLRQMRNKLLPRLMSGQIPLTANG